MPDRLTLLTLLGIAALAAALTACGDDPLGPDARFDLIEAEAVMESAAALPSLPEITASATAVDPGQAATLVRAQELWIAASAASRTRGSAQRRLAAGYAAPALAVAVPAEDWVAVRTRIDRWLGTAARMTQQLSMPTVEARLDDARRNLVRADAAPTTESRVYHLLLAASDLTETTPRFIATTLTHDAALAVQRAEARADEDAGARSLARARRLADWAVQALEEEDHLRAMQRAYYAKQLVEGQ